MVLFQHTHHVMLGLNHVISGYYFHDLALVTSFEAIVCVGVKGGGGGASLEQGSAVNHDSN